MPPERIPEPWSSFLSEIDAGLSEEVEFHCLGGFVVTVVYGFERPTAEVDVLAVVPQGEIERLLGLAGKASALHRKHGLYLDLMTVATAPEDYEQRLVEVAAGASDYSPSTLTSWRSPSLSATSSGTGTT